MTTSNDVYVVHHEHEPYDYYVGRSTPFGNPFHIGVDGTREEVVKKFRVYLLSNAQLLARIRLELRGKILGCHCKPLACHAEVLAEIANGLV